MTDKKTIVMAIRLKSGDNLLGFYFGESPEDASEQRVILFKPVTVKLVTYNLANKPINAYVTNPYFQYGSGVVSIPYSEISHQDIASEFFTSFYIRSLSDLNSLEEELHDSYTKFFYDSDLRAIMKNTDSIYVDIESEYTQ